MRQQVDKFELGALGLSSGEARSVELRVPVEELMFGEQRYSAGGGADAMLDVSHTTTGYALRLRFSVDLEGPCTRCLENAGASIAVDAREVDQPSGGAEGERRSPEHRPMSSGAEDDGLRSPYVEDGVVDLAAWARDALALALPTQILCSEECRGLCVVCGANLNEDPEHAHEREPDPRWAKLAELKLEE